MSKHYILYIPGLGDSRIRGQKLALSSWKFWGVKTKVLQMNWADDRSFEPKLQLILDHIDRLKTRGYTVSLVAVSAGASAALNAYAERIDSVHSVTLICGQILGGHKNVHPRVYDNHTSFGDSIQMLGSSLDKLDDAARSRIVSVHPIFDMTVPVADTKLPGARWRQIPVTGHFMSIAYGITIDSRRIVRDLKSLKSRP